MCVKNTAPQMTQKNKGQGDDTEYPELLWGEAGNCGIPVKNERKGVNIHNNTLVRDSEDSENESGEWATSHWTNLKQDGTLPTPTIYLYN